MSAPSSAAVTAAVIAQRSATASQGMADRTRAVLEAAHDPELGINRSVCLYDVVMFLNRSTSGDVALMTAYHFGVKPS